jgi:hypothetical protein
MFVDSNICLHGETQCDGKPCLVIGLVITDWELFCDCHCPAANLWNIYNALLIKELPLVGCIHLVGEEVSLNLAVDGIELLGGCYYQCGISIYVYVYILVCTVEVIGELSSKGDVRLSIDYIGVDLSELEVFLCCNNYYISVI